MSANGSKPTGSGPPLANVVDISSSEDQFANFTNFAAFYESMSTAVRDMVASSTKLPLKQSEFDYYLTCPAFKEFMQTQNTRLLKMMGSLMKLQNVKRANSIQSARLDDDERTDLLIDTNDQIIEKLGIQLDEIQGLRKKTEIELKLGDTLNATTRNINTSWNKNVGMVVDKSLLQSNSPRTATSTTGAHVQANVAHHKKGTMAKSQLMFPDKIDNSHLPFVPKIRTKHNAMRPLPQIYSTLEIVEINEKLFQTNAELQENPYMHEIEQFEPTELELQGAPEPVPFPPPLADTPLRYIDDVVDLIQLCDHLSNRSEVKEIAVDLEHHSYRSFLGFTCLMQISTRKSDYIIDTLALRADMHRLNTVFTDFTLLKVLHGADYDVEWLQKDFGIYLVNMFDTGQASRLLQFPHFSLSYLLQKYCGVQAQKQYQMADWRQRPLSAEMLKYAREDTHYLLYIYDRIKNELLQQKCDMLTEAYAKSKLICKKIYKKPLFYSKGFLALCQHNSHLNAKQMKGLHDLYVWRDKMARETDESTEYVLKNHQLLKISELLPREIYGILALCNPISSVVERNVHEILDIVKNARDYKGLMTTITDAQVFDTAKQQQFDLFARTITPKAAEQAFDSIVHSSAYDPNSILNCPHDLPHRAEQGDVEMEEEAAVHTIGLTPLELFKPERVMNQTLPDGLVACEEPDEKSSLGNMFKLERSTVAKKKLKEKITTIKTSLRNPFELFLPNTLRASTTHINEPKWTLLKPVTKTAVQSQQAVVEPSNENDEVQDNEGVISLKQRSRLEHHGHETKKRKKQLKHVDFSEAIAEYNRSKEPKIVSLGGDMDEDMENGGQEESAMSAAIRANLQQLSHSIKSEVDAAAKTKVRVAQQLADFHYDAANMNDMFAKPVAPSTSGQFDPSSKLKRGGNFKSSANKRRQTNALTRNKHNKSLTFKAPSGKTD